MKVSFTQHKLTEKQLEEIGQIDLDLTNLANRNITTLEEARDVATEILLSLGSEEHVDVYGVIPTPIRHVLRNKSGYDASVARMDVRIYESFNVNRAKEGEKPSFEHAGWLLTEQYYFV